MTIWAAKTKEPVIPMSGARRSSLRSPSRRDDRATTSAEAAQSVTPTAGERRASAMCTVAVRPTSDYPTDGA